jgi:hypothetical protein
MVRSAAAAAAATTTTPTTVVVVQQLDMTHRPRRSNPDTIQYLRQLLPMLQQQEQGASSTTTIEDKNNNEEEDHDDETNQNKNKKKEQDDDEEVAYIMQQGLHEIRHELASVASTEIGSAVLERMITLLLRRKTSSSSSSSADSTKDDDTAADGGSGMNVHQYPLLLWNGLSPYMNHLAVHRYGSHVLQRLIHETTHLLLCQQSGSPPW